MEKLLFVDRSSLSGAFVKALEEEGFQVEVFPANVPEFRPGFALRFWNILQRKFFGKKDVLLQKEKEFREKKFISTALELVKKGAKFEHCLMMRGDVFPDEMLALLRAISSQMISYEFDGLEVCKAIYGKKKFFDRVFVFDPDDYAATKNEGFLPLTNCWFPQQKTNNSAPEFDLFYVGVGVPQRLKWMENVQKYCAENEISLKAFLTVQSYVAEQSERGVSYIHQPLPYAKNLELSAQSAAVIDFKLSYHNGLSFRFFEAMLLQKKVITNNESVKNYDFYHPQNILVTDFNQLDGVKEFLSTPYVPLEKDILEKYGFPNWIRYVLEKAPFQRIDLPA